MVDLRVSTSMAEGLCKSWERDLCCKRCKNSNFKFKKGNLQIFNSRTHQQLVKLSKNIQMSSDYNEFEFGNIFFSPVCSGVGA